VRKPDFAWRIINCSQTAQLDFKHRETASRGEVAEGSRPAREVEKKVKDATRKPSGRKQKDVQRPAKYVNWMTPFSWSAIQAAQRQAGWSSSAIVARLQRANYDFFQHLTESTVRGWIEARNGFSQWKPTVLARTSKGNIPGHNTGGRRGILVSIPCVIVILVSG
jgi:hypothetical protein